VLVKQEFGFLPTSNICDNFNGRRWDSALLWIYPFRSLSFECNIHHDHHMARRLRECWRIINSHRVEWRVERLGEVRFLQHGLPCERVSGINSWPPVCPLELGSHMESAKSTLRLKFKKRFPLAVISRAAYNSERNPLSISPHSSNENGKRIG